MKILHVRVRNFMLCHFYLNAAFSLKFEDFKHRDGTASVYFRTIGEMREFTKRETVCKTRDKRASPAVFANPESVMALYDVMSQTEMRKYSLRFLLKCCSKQEQIIFNGQGPSQAILCHSLAVKLQVFVSIDELAVILLYSMFFLK